MTKAQKACWRKTLGVEESNVTFLFLGKKPLGRYFPLSFPSGWDPSRGQDEKVLPVHAPTEVLRNTEVIYSGEWISKWKVEMWGRRKEESIL